MVTCNFSNITFANYFSQSRKIIALQITALRCFFFCKNHRLLQYFEEVYLDSTTAFSYSYGNLYNLLQDKRSLWLSQAGSWIVILCASFFFNDTQALFWQRSSVCKYTCRRLLSNSDVSSRLQLRRSFVTFLKSIFLLHANRKAWIKEEKDFPKTFHFRKWETIKNRKSLSNRKITEKLQTWDEQKFGRNLFTVWIILRQFFYLTKALCDL